MMYVKIKAIAVGHDGIEQEIELKASVLSMVERDDGTVLGMVGLDDGEPFASFDFKPEPGFNAWGRPMKPTMT